MPAILVYGRYKEEGLESMSFLDYIENSGQPESNGTLVKRTSKQTNKQKQPLAPSLTKQPAVMMNLTSLTPRKLKQANV